MTFLLHLSDKKLIRRYTSKAFYQLQLHGLAKPAGLLGAECAVAVEELHANILQLSNSLPCLDVQVFVSISGNGYSLSF